MTKTKSKKPKTQKVLMPPSADPKPLSAKEGSLQAIALCHKLIAEAPYSYAYRDQIAAALDYLEILHKQCEAIKDSEVETPKAEAVTTKKKASLELVNDQP